MTGSSDPEKRRAEHIASRLIDAQDRRGVRNALAGEFIIDVSREAKREVFQDDPRAASLIRKRVAALAAEIKSSTPRVVLVGESVARGFPYDPQFNCALALRKLLNLATGADEVEVIDLAQVGLTYAGLIDLIESALALNPDAFVVFAGNNWRIPSGVRVDGIAEILRAKKSWQAVIEQIKEEIRRAVKALMVMMRELSARHSIPFIFVIPEFNAADWRSPQDWRNPLLAGSRSRLWQQLRTEAQSALADHDYNKAAVSSKAMIDLDGGASPVAYEILATCSRLLGDNEEARRFIDTAGDIGLCVPVLKQPRCFPVIQQTLRSECAGSAVVMVDLPTRISESLAGALPDRNLFLDSCHMTIEGMRLAMACTAESLLPLLGKRKMGWRELNVHEFHMDRRVLAEAHFNAARMNARSGQSYEIVRFHFKKAIEHTPEVINLGVLFAGLCLRHMPYMMCRTFEELLSRRDVFPSISSLAAGSPVRRVHFNLLEIQALKDAIAESIPEAGERIDRLLRDEHAVEIQEVNLLSAPYCDIPFEHLGFEWWEGAIYLRAYEPQSLFHLICDRPDPIQLKLTCRLRCQPMGDETVSVVVNGCLIDSSKVSTRWTQHTCTIPAENLRGGVNSLVLAWPEPQESLEERVEKITMELERSEPLNRWNRLPDIYPVYGEVHAFSAAARNAHADVEAANRSRVSRNTREAAASIL
jgi:hypothetical protein